jgi:hypothetical protein
MESPPLRQSGDHGFKSRQDRPRPHSSAAEHQDDNLERHVRLVLRVLRSCSEKDITLDYESRGWGFKSLRERASLASSMGEHLVHSQGTEVRFRR